MRRLHYLKHTQLKAVHSHSYFPSLNSFHPLAAPCTVLKLGSQLQTLVYDRWLKFKQSPQLPSTRLVATGLQAVGLCQKKRGIFDLFIPWPHGLSGSQRETLIRELFQNTHLERRGTQDGKWGEKDGREVEVKECLGLMWKDQVHCGLPREERSVPGRLVNSRLTGNHCTTMQQPLLGTLSTCRHWNSSLWGSTQRSICFSGCQGKRGPAGTGGAAYQRALLHKPAPGCVRAGGRERDRCVFVCVGTRQTNK